MSTSNLNHSRTSSAPPSSHRSQPDIDDEPPPYTPAVDVYQGERILEVGPTRPFQQPQQTFVHSPHRPTSHARPSANSGWSSSGYLSPPNTYGAHTNNQTQPRSLLRQITGQLVSSLEEYSRERERSRQTSPPTTVTPRRVPPALSASERPPALPPRRHSSDNPSSQEPQSDFARDFYAAGTGDVDRVRGDDDSIEIPPTPPPRDSPPPSRPRNNNFDPSDTRPTTTPIPGRPLLNEGRLLVYPAGHWCDRCQNTGYKKGQPSKPCSKCWSKYAKPYTGALAYAPSANNPNGPTNSTSFQRPLPAAAPAPAPVQRHTTLQRPRSQNYGGSTSSMPPGALHRSRTGAGYAPQHAVSSPALSYSYQNMNRGPMNPSTVVVRPGDIRLGGRLCWKCNGSGVKPSLTAFLLGSEETCYICGGVGRIRS